MRSPEKVSEGRSTGAVAPVEALWEDALGKDILLFTQPGSG